MNALQGGIILTLIVFGVGAFLVYVGFFPPKEAEVCSEKWICSSWSSCEEGKQTRACVETANCPTPDKKPVTQRECGVVQPMVCGDSLCDEGENCATCATDCGICRPDCSENWVCSPWSTCVGGNQTRACTDSNQCGTTLQKPLTSQSCSCIENWSCTGWSICVNDVQTRSCTDLHSCASVVTKPAESQSCSNVDTEDPSFTHFYVQSGNAQNQAFFSATDDSPPITYTLLRSTNTVLLQGVQVLGTANSYDYPPPGVFRIYSGTATSFLDSGLVNGTTYYYGVRACDLSSNPNCIVYPGIQNGTPSSGSSPDTSPPIINTFSLLPRDSKIQVSYAASEAGSVTSLPVRYTLVRAATAASLNNLSVGAFQNGGTGITILVNDSTQGGPYQDLGLVNGTTYYYRLQACDSAPAPNCAASTTLSGTPQPSSGGDTTPPTITTFTASPGDAVVALNYGAIDPGPTNSPPVRFVIIRGLSASAVNAIQPGSFSNGGTGVTVVMPSTTQPSPFNDTSVSNGNTYYYRLEACDSAPIPNCSGSNAVPATPNASSPDTTPPIISVFSLQPGLGQVAISYAASDPGPNSTPPVKYTIIRGTNQTQVDAVLVGRFDSPSPGVTIVLPSTTQPGPFDDTTVQNETTYFYRLQACDSKTPNPNCAGTPSQSTIPGEITFGIGAQEKVWDYGTSSCNTQNNLWDLPDLQAHAVRTHTIVGGQPELLLSRGNAPNNYFMFGTNFTDLQTNCSQGPVIGSGNTTNPNAAPSTYYHQQWIGGMYRDTSTNRIHALVHNEFHDGRNITNTPCSIGDVFASNPCNETSITYAWSDDGGHTFQQNTANAAHLVAASPVAWDPFLNSGVAPTYGQFIPSNIIQRTNYYYSVFHAINSPIPHSSTRGVCIMRTNNLGDPSSWRAWDGTDFTIQLRSPWGSNPNTQNCAFISKNQIDQLAGSLTYNTYLQKYLLMGSSVKPKPGVVNPNPANPNDWICGFYYSTSTDLINWTNRKLIREAVSATPPCHQSGQPIGAEIYPSLIDHAQLADPTDPNFEKTTNRPHLYFTRWNNGPDRDLWRQPLTICQVGNPVSGCP